MRISDWSSDVCSSDLETRTIFEAVSPTGGAHADSEVDQAGHRHPRSAKSETNHSVGYRGEGLRSSDHGVGYQDLCRPVSKCRGHQASYEPRTIWRADCRPDSRSRETETG